MAEVAMSSWEYAGLTNWKLAARQPLSQITTKPKLEADRRFLRNDINTLDLWEEVIKNQPVGPAAGTEDTNLLRLADQE